MSERILWDYTVVGKDGNLYHYTTSREAAERLRHDYPQEFGTVGSPRNAKYGQLYGEHLNAYFRRDPYKLKQYGDRLSGLCCRKERYHLICDHCGRKIYEGYKVVTVDGYTTNFCSYGCAAEYFLDINASILHKPSDSK